MPAIKRINCSEARTTFRKLIGDAERGISHLITRNGKPVAAIVPAELAVLAPMLHDVLGELGQSMHDSQDPNLTAAVKRAMDEIARGRVVTYDA